MFTLTVGMLFSLCCLCGCSAHTHREREVIPQHPGLQPQGAAAHSSAHPLTRCCKSRLWRPAHCPRLWVLK